MSITVTIVFTSLRMFRQKRFAMTRYQREKPSSNACACYLFVPIRVVSYPSYGLSRFVRKAPRYGRPTVVRGRVSLGPSSSRCAVRGAHADRAERVFALCSRERRAIPATTWQSRRTRRGPTTVRRHARFFVDARRYPSITFPPVKFIASYVAHTRSSRLHRSLSSFPAILLSLFFFLLPRPTIILSRKIQSCLHGCNRKWFTRVTRSKSFVVVSLL